LACQRCLFLDIFSSADLAGRPAYRRAIHPVINGMIAGAQISRRP
jgi:hypothetical protein